MTNFLETLHLLHYKYFGCNQYSFWLCSISQYNFAVSIRFKHSAQTLAVLFTVNDQVQFLAVFNFQMKIGMEHKRTRGYKMQWAMKVFGTFYSVQCQCEIDQPGDRFYDDSSRLRLVKTHKDQAIKSTIPHIFLEASNKWIRSLQTALKLPWRLNRWVLWGYYVVVSC